MGENGKTLIPSGEDISVLRESMLDYAAVKKRNFGDPDINFEFKKELVRLHLSPSKQYTLATLKRLADFHWRLGNSFPPEDSDPFMTLVKQYIPDVKSIRDLQRRRDITRYFNSELEEKAKEPLLLALAKQGDPQFQYHLGKFLARKDSKSAIAWLERAGDHGFVAADFQRGRLYDDLARVAKGEDHDRLKKLAQQAYLRAVSTGVPRAEKGDPWAALTLAEMYDSSLAGLKYDPQMVQRHLCAGVRKLPRGYPSSYLIENAKCD